jgi:hypothetical protein
LPAWPRNVKKRFGENNFAILKNISTFVKSTNNKNIYNPLKNNIIWQKLLSTASAESEE